MMLAIQTTPSSLVAQGSSEKRFAYWLPMFTSTMRSVQFADWWAEVTGLAWRKTLSPDSPDSPGEVG